MIKEIIFNCFSCKHYRTSNFCNLLKNFTEIVRKEENLCGIYGKYFERRQIKDDEQIK
jgi:hypothetical protein